MSDAGVIRARYDGPDSFRHGLQVLKDADMRDFVAYAPTNLVDFDDLLPLRISLNRFFAISAGAVGLAVFWLMCLTTAWIYSLVVGGKPPTSNVPYVIPAYEGAILLAAIVGFTAVFIFARLGLHLPPSDYDGRFSQDSFGIDVRCGPDERDTVTEMLKSTGAVEVHERSQRTSSTVHLHTFRLAGRSFGRSDLCRSHWPCRGLCVRPGMRRGYGCSSPLSRSRG